MFLSTAAHHWLQPQLNHIHRNMTPKQTVCHGIFSVDLVPTMFGSACCPALQLSGTSHNATTSPDSSMDAAFVRITCLSKSEQLESRLRFMLLDIIEQRQNGWEERRKVEGPKRTQVIVC